jgi:predicted hydrocarbon binding protein
MTNTMAQATTTPVGIPRRALHTLIGALYRDLGGNAAAYLQEAGYTAGIYDAFESWLAKRSAAAPEGIEASRFGELASEFFTSVGWGTLTVGQLGQVATLDSSDWAEANPDNPMEFPACYFSAGMIGELFSKLADAQVIALEVECRSNGAERCRFLVGAPDVIQRVYDGLAAGEHYTGLVG